AGLAMLLPPRTEAPRPVVQLSLPAAQNSARQIPAVPLSITMPLTNPVAPAPSMTAPQMAAGFLRSFDVVPLLFAAWVTGALAMALWLARLQLRFDAAARSGEAGPAVAGFFRPRVVVPSGFADTFSDAEQAAILAHERVHLARQDARINALSALL